MHTNTLVVCNSWSAVATAGRAERDSRAKADEGRWKASLVLRNLQLVSETRAVLYDLFLLNFVRMLSLQLGLTWKFRTMPLTLQFN